MKLVKLLIATIVLMSLSPVLFAQEDYDFYLQKARQRLAEGDCTRAEASYNTYKDMAHKTNKEIERLIEECKNGGLNSLGSEQTSVSGNSNGHDYVDLGLPSGTLWATCNIGANKPEDYGNYYAWGETSTKSTYNWDTYKYATGNYDKLTKYCNNSDYGNNGFTDNLTELQNGDDPATANWGSGWQTPSKAQWDELLANTTNTNTIQNGVNGILFSAKNGRTLFLPAAGRYAGSYYDSSSCYWSCSLYSTLYSSDSDFAAAFRVCPDPLPCHICGARRYLGLSVRPVCEKECTTTKTVTRTRVVISGDSDEVIRAANKILNGN